MDQKNNKKDIEARKLIAQIQSGDTEAEARLVELYKEFTASVMRQYKGKGLSDEEITSACESALKRAARKFDLNKDFAFISYAIWWMKKGSSVKCIDKKKIYIMIKIKLASSIFVVTKLNDK